MKLPENPQPAAHPITFAGALVLAALVTLPVAGLAREAAPDAGSGSDGAEIRSVSADAEPCLTVRQRPSRRARIVDCLETGSRVTVTGTRGIWSRVATGNGVSGWVTSGFLVAPAPDPGATVAASREPQPEVLPAPAEQEAPVAQEAPRAGAIPRPIHSAPVRIVVATEPGDGLAGEPAAEGAAQADADRGEPDEPAGIDAQRAATPEVDRDQLAERARLAEERVAVLEGERDQLDQRATIAEERVMVLEAEVEAAGAALGARDDETADLAARVEELTRERDELDRALKRAEAQMFYLRSDLEQTRGELMRLKGVPAQLVAPEAEPEPEPVAAVPEPAPAPDPPAAAAEAEPAAPPATPPFMVIDELVGTIRAWAQAWADQRADDYLSFYSPSFTPADGQSREAWAATRRERIRAPRSIVLALDRINPIVSGDRASVSFDQSYTSESFSDTVAKTLVLERSPGGRWLIVEERVE